MKITALVHWGAYLKEERPDWWWGQQHDGTIMKVTVKTICDGSAERTDPYSTSQGAATGEYGGYSGLASVGI